MTLRDEGCNNLRIAIIGQAIKDYRKTLRDVERNCRKRCPLPEDTLRYEASVNAMERWFLSEWGELLSGGCGAEIIEKVTKEVQAEFAELEAAQ